MVHLELGQDNAGIISVTGDLADFFNAGIIGISGCQSLRTSRINDDVNVDLIRADNEKKLAEMAALESEFRYALQIRTSYLGWRRSVNCSSIADYIATESCSADLLIVKASSDTLFDFQRSMNSRELLMQLGRPMFVVPPNLNYLRLQTIMIAWKDTLESRRAIYDALPLLKKSRNVIVVEAADISEQGLIRRRLEIVVAWLLQHNIKAEALPVIASGDEKEKLKVLAKERKVDVLVAGAYGHSDLHHCGLVNMTKDILSSDSHCSLLSH
ncbi:universal stress protein [Undibacterium sp. SXout7W]|uniref:universal stress protein n=1 Tax=Undibacterium sp. SXout7W TaxID=3413049 RepID=UPI003BEF5F89